MARAGVALTFDDGPHPVWTRRVAGALHRAGARATFFVVAPKALAHADVIDELRAAGHAVALHCARHVRHTRTTREAIERDTDEALAALARLGLRPRSWRPPWGARAPWTAKVAAARELELTGWTLDTHDWRGDAAGAMLAAVSPGLAAGAVVLMHDGLGPGARRTTCAQTARLVEPLVASIRARGLEPALAP